MRSERWLTRRAARGDQDAFAAIFRRHQQDLHRYCVAILGDPDDAQDALQNTMVKALRALPGERREIALKPWLFRIAHNEAIELRRSERPAVPLADVELPAGASLEQVATERWKLRELLADLATLPLRQRGALVMRELAGFDFEQIAIALETTPAAARQVLYEARRGLREMAEGHEMRCDAVTATLSDGDGRVARRRDLRAHLRDCPDCRAFAEEIAGRGETLAAIAPLPALAAAAMVKGALASGAGTAAAGGATGAGGAGLAAGAAAKVGSTAAIVKSAIGVVAIVAVGAVAADRSHLVHLGGSGGDSPAAHSAGPGQADGASTQTVGGGGDKGGGNESLRVSRARVSFAHRRASVGARPAARGAGSGDVHASSTAGPNLARTDRSADLVAATSAADPGRASNGRQAHGDPSARAGRQARGADHSASAAGTVHPDHPAHPVHPPHPAPSADAPEGHPEHPPHPSHPEPPTNPEPAAAALPVEPAGSPAPEVPPGQVRKESREEEPAS